MSVSAGRILLMSRGDWNADIAYKNLDWVRHNNASWVCKKQCTNIEPSATSTEHWQILAEDGAASPLIGDTNDLLTENKIIVDAINEVFQLGNENKSKLVDNLIAMGVTASTEDTWASLIGKVLTIFTGTDVSDTTASAGDVLSGKVFYNNDGVRSTGNIEEHTEYTSAVSLYCVGRTSADTIYVRIPKGAYLKDIGIGYPEITTTVGDILSAAGINDKNYSSATSVALWDGSLYMRMPQGYYHGGTDDGAGSEAEISAPISDVASALGVDSTYMSERINISGVQGAIPDYRGKGAIATPNIRWNSDNDRLEIAALRGIYDCDWGSNYQCVDGATARSALGISADKILSSQCIAGTWGTATAGRRYAYGTSYEMSKVVEWYKKLYISLNNITFCDASGMLKINTGTSWSPSVVKVSFVYNDHYLFAIMAKDFKACCIFEKLNHDDNNWIPYNSPVCSLREKSTGTEISCIQGSDAYVVNWADFNGSYVSNVSWEAWE